MISFVDAQEMHRKYSHCFEVPSDSALNSLVIGDYVKICEDNERFWVELIEVNGKNLSGRVDNDLFFPHDFKCDDIVHFETRHIYDIL